MPAKQHIKKLIFLVQWPVTPYEEKAWHFDILKEKGFKVEVLDLSYLLNSSIMAAKVVTNQVHADYIHYIDTYKKLNIFLENNSNNSLFIDYLVNHSNLTIHTEKVYRLLKKNQVQYIVISSGALPGISFEKSASGQLKKIISKIQKALNFKVLLDYLCSKIIMFLTRRGIFYPVPVRVFGGNSSEAMRHFIASRDMDSKSIIPINSFDYDTYVKGLGQTLEGVATNDKYCIFLDEALTNHPDFAFLNIDYISPDEYFLSMNRLFDFIEQQMGLRVIIAAHPRSIYEKTPGVFKNRTIIKGKTASLTAGSELVIMHMSTSVSFAVIGQKPVVVVKTEGIQNNFYLDKLVDNMAGTIGAQLINIDRVELSQKLLSMPIDQEKYNSYLYKYVKSPNAQDLTVWDIVVSEIKKLSKEK